MTESKIRKIIADETLSKLESVEVFLHYLGEPTWILISGKNHQSCRLITTLLHGNEPSGCHAIFRLLKEGIIPEFDTWVLIASISTALEEPKFSRRAKIGAQDINRCFKPPWQTDIEQLAAQIIKDISDFNPQAVIDVHNTSGAGPGFCVATSSTDESDKIAGIFSNSLVITDIKLGALMEVDFNCPILTIECGGNQSELSNMFAYNGIKKYLSAEDLSLTPKTEDLQYYLHPLRLELKNDCQLTYGDDLVDNSDITLCHSIEEQNFGTTVPEKRLGWIGHKGLGCLQVLNPEQQDLIEDYFIIKEGELFTRVPLHLFMVTKNRLIAESDCLFYLTPAVIS